MDLEIPEPSSVLDWGFAKEEKQDGKENIKKATVSDDDGVLELPTSSHIRYAANNSLDSSVILQQHYANLDVQRNMAAKQWVFPESDVIFPDTIDKNTTASTTNNNQPTIFLGRGTFGEVYVGKWRHVDVAVKKLHQAVSVRRTYNIRVQDNKEQVLDSAGNSTDNNDVSNMVASIKQQKDAAYENRVHLSELEVLTKLRHPNLVLLLGICHDAADATFPTMILTELMSCSLYDIL